MLRFASFLAVWFPLWVATPMLADQTASADALAKGGSKTAASKKADDKKKAEEPLHGKTIDIEYDASDVKDKSRAYSARVFIHDEALKAKGKLPLVVFIHGLNRDLIPHRWMGGGNEGDVRRIVSDLIERKVIPPVILAGPGSIEKAAVSGGSSFPVFDFDRFVELVESGSSSSAAIDCSRIVVTGHSGAGCSKNGGIIAAARAKTKPLAVVSIDTCMGGELAQALGNAPDSTHVVVTWQTASWERNFKHFEAVWGKEVAAHPAKKGIFRELDHLPALPRSHDATVPQTYEKWLAKLLAN